MNQFEMIHEYNKKQLEVNPQYKLMVWKNKALDLTNGALNIEDRLSGNPNEKDLGALFTEKELDIIDVIKSFDRYIDIQRIELGRTNEIIFSYDTRYKIVTSDIKNLIGAMKHYRSEYDINKELKDYNLLFDDTKTCDEIRNIFKFKDIEKGLDIWAEQEGNIFSKDSKDNVFVYNSTKQKFEIVSNSFDISSLEFCMDINRK